MTSGGEENYPFTLVNLEQKYSCKKGNFSAAAKKFTAVAILNKIKQGSAFDQAIAPIFLSYKLIFTNASLQTPPYKRLLANDM